MLAPSANDYEHFGYAQAKNEFEDSLPCGEPLDSVRGWAHSECLFSARDWRES